MVESSMGIFMHKDKLTSEIFVRKECMPFALVFMMPIIYLLFLLLVLLHKEVNASYLILFLFSVEGINAFTIGVGDTFDATTFIAGDYTTCATFAGYPKHGDVNNIFSCGTAQTGHYVAIYASYGAARSFSICEVEVHTRSGKVFTSAANSGKLHSLSRPYNI